MEEVFIGFGWKAQGEILLGRSSCRWEDNIKRDLKKIGIDETYGFIWLRVESNGELL
jgi:hypothetical protein